MRKIIVFLPLFFFISCKKAKIETSATLQFMVFGDWGRQGKQNQQDVANQMNTSATGQNIQFVISTGDNFYETGVASTEDTQWKTSFENIYTGSLLQIPWYVVLGNHDYQSNPSAEIAYTKKSLRWNMPNRYYSFTKTIDANTTALFVFIDTNPLIDEYIKNPNMYADLSQQNVNQQLNWLDNTLLNSSATYKIVVGHHPIYSAGYGHGNQAEMISLVKPILEKNKVDVYFCGHSHSSQYLKLNSNKLQYLVAGAGSLTDELITVDSSAIFGTASPSFALCSLSKNGIQTKFIDTAGNVMFQH